MSRYEKAVLDLLKNGPKQRKWLVNQVTPLIMSEKKLQKTIDGLKASGKAVASSRQAEGKGRWETWYMLPGQEYLFDVNEGRIIGAIDRLKSIISRMPTVDELALEVGIPPSEVEKIAYKLAAQTGWYNPTQKLIEDSKNKLGESLVCAARIRDKCIAENGNSNDFNYFEKDAVIIEEANRLLKEHPSLLPNLSDDGKAVISWPSETLRFLGENYVPENRDPPAFSFGSTSPYKYRY